MSDKLGIITRYQLNEITHAGLFLAEYAESHGISVAVRSKGDCQRAVSPRWDTTITTDSTSLDDWLPGLRRVLWTECPSAEELVYVRELGIETMALVVWDTLTAYGMEVLRNIDQVLCPYMCISEQLDRYLGQRSRFLPWDVSMPIVERPAESQEVIRVYLPLYDTLMARMDETTLYGITEAIAVSNASLTLAGGRGWESWQRRWKNSTAKVLRGRFSVITQPDTLTRYQLFTNHDLTLAPALVDSLLHTTLASLCAGTPVLGWDMPPITEVIQPGINGYLVPCTVERNWLGLPIMLSDTKAYGTRLRSLLQHPAEIDKIRTAKTDAALARRHNFENGWKSLDF